MKTAGKSKIIVVVGPTASGKSDLAVHLAKKFDGEVVSADSRQVYRGLDIGTGKITKREMKGVPHHLLDVASPRRAYSAARYKQDATRAVRYIVQNRKVPIIAGGTGFYVDALLGTVSIPKVPPDKALRDRLEKKSSAQLFALLSKLDPARVKTVDPHNRRRLIRAIEVAQSLGAVPPKSNKYSSILEYEMLWLGLALPKSELEKKIYARIIARMRKGMVAEARRLRAQGLSHKRMEGLGLEYRYLSRHLRGLISKEEFIKQLCTATKQYVKRQKTWFRRNTDIHWFHPSETRKIEHLVKVFLE